MRTLVMGLVFVLSAGTALSGCAVQTSDPMEEYSPSAAPPQGIFAPDILPNSRMRTPGT